MELHLTGLARFSSFLNPGQRGEFKQLIATVKWHILLKILATRFLVSCMSSSTILRQMLVLIHAHYILTLLECDYFYLYPLNFLQLLYLTF